MKLPGTLYAGLTVTVAAISLATGATAAPLIVNPGQTHTVTTAETIDGASSNNGGTIRILQPSGDLRNYGSLLNQGALTNEAGFYNFGTMTNIGLVVSTETSAYAEFYSTTVGATFNNFGITQIDSAFYSDGTFNNHATFDLNSGYAFIRSTGTINNTGAINNVGGDVEIFGTLNNSGLINNAESFLVRSASTFDNTGGTVNNNGFFFLEKDLTLGSTAAGTINLNTDGTLNVTNGKTLSVHGSHTQINNGTLTIDRDSEFRNFGTFDNNGTLNIDASGGDSGLGINAGTLDNSGTLNNSGGFLNAGGTLTNETGATFSNSGILLNHAVISNSGTLDNSSTIDNQGGFNILAGSTMTGNGSFTQTAGSLTVDGAMTQSSVAINGGTLGGSGTIAAAVTIDGGTVGPGNSPGLLEILGDVDFMAGSTLAVELADTVFGGGTGYDRLDVTDDGSTAAVEGTVTLAAGTLFDIDFFGAFTAGLGDEFDVLVADDIDSAMLSAMLFDFTDAALASGLVWGYGIVDFGGGREALRLSVIAEAVTEVPEPGIALLFVFGVAGIGLARRRHAA